MAVYEFATSPYHRVQIEANLAETDVPNNRWRVEFALRALESSNYGAWSSPIPWALNVLGYALGGSGAYDFRGAPDTVVFAAASVWINANPDGSPPSTTISGSYSDTGFPGGIGAGTASGSLVLPSIPRGCKVRVGGVFKPGLVKVRVGGAWKTGLVKVRVGGAWKVGI